MTPITDMALPDAVVEKALQVFYDAWLHRLSDKQRMQAAIRAVLQAMLDCGMASISTHNAPGVPIFQLRLDADERKRALQEERK